MHVLSTRIHTIIGLVVGLVLMMAPWLFDFADLGTAGAVAVAVGLFAVLNELTSTSPISPFKLIPMQAHIALDVLAGLFLLASPWLLGFSHLAANAWIPHVIVGILMAGYALITDTADQRSTVAHA